jgi:hypothetical protein
MFGGDKPMHKKEKKNFFFEEKFAHLKGLSNPATLLKKFESSSSHSYQIVDAEINIDLDPDVCLVCGSRLPASGPSRSASNAAAREATRIDASYVPRIPQTLQQEDVEWEAKWSNILLNEMSNFHSVEVFCRAMLMQMDITFPEIGKDADQPNYLRVAAALDMLDILIPVLGSFQPVMSRLRDEFVRGIYMPEKKGKMSEDADAKKRSMDISVSSQKHEGSRTRTVRSLSGNAIDSGSANVASSEAVRAGASYFSRTPYFKSGIRTATDAEWLRGMDQTMKALEASSKNLQLQVAELEMEKTVLEKRIEGFQLRTQTMETEMDLNGKRWAKKEATFLKEIEVLTEKLDVSMVQSQTAASDADHSTAEHSQSVSLLTKGASMARQGAPAMPMYMPSAQDASAAGARLEKDRAVLQIIQKLANILIDFSRKESQNLCADMRATTQRFEKTPTVRMLLKQGETCVEFDRTSRFNTQELLTRWISAHLKQAVNNSLLPEGSTFVIKNLTTDLDDGLVLLDFINLVLPKDMKWPEEKVSTARIGSLETRGSLFAQTMVALTADPQWEEVDLFKSGDGSLDVRIRFLSLLYLLSASLNCTPWGTGQQLAANYNKMQDEAEHLEYCSDKLLQLLEAAALSSEPLSAIGPNTGASLFEAVKVLESHAAEARCRIADADAELHEMRVSTRISQTALMNLYSCKSNQLLKDVLGKSKKEFERGQEEGFEEAKRQGLIHAQMQRAMGQTEIFSRSRLKLGFAKLLLGNLDKDRFQDIATPEFERGLNPEHFVRWMEQCASVTLDHSTDIVKVFRCYARLQESREHPTADGISLHVEQFLALLQAADLLQTDGDFSREKISALQGVNVFRMACRVKYFHQVQVDSSQKLADALNEIQRDNENTLKMPNFIEALARISWTIIRQISSTAIAHWTSETVFKQVATRCDQLDVDHFLTSSSASNIKDLLRPAVDTALRKYAGTDAWPRKSKRSMAPSEFATLLKVCHVYDEIGSDAVGWCFWRVDHEIEEEAEEWGSGADDPSSRRLAPTALHRALCYVSEFLVRDPLVPLIQKVTYMLDQYLAPSLLGNGKQGSSEDQTGGHKGKKRESKTRNRKDNFEGDQHRQEHEAET